jgi:hypothetical protein
MQIGQRVLAKVNGKVEECIVEKIGFEDLILNTGKETISRKYWEIRKYEK